MMMLSITSTRIRLSILKALIRLGRLFKLTPLQTYRFAKYFNLVKNSDIYL